MAKPLKICFISTYIPRECGIATYTNNLIGAIRKADQKVKMSVIAMNDKDYDYPGRVKLTINEKDNKDYKKAADYINKRNFDVVSLQHEFGIFGGFNGNKIYYLLKNLEKPVIMTMHTVPICLTAPYSIKAKRYKSRSKLLKKILPYISAITVMTETAKKFIAQEFNYPANRIYLIPHGAPDIPNSQIKSYQEEKSRLGFNKNDFIISTFGLISPKKGLEYVIHALPKIIKANPEKSIKYAILGKTHPKKPKTYIRSLINLSKKLGLENNVIFDRRYLKYSEIYRYLSNTDIYITPYYSKEQASSGTLSYAISTGRCVVSTPYIFAQDIIKNHKIGELVEFKDQSSIEKAINHLIQNPKLISQYEKNSRDVGNNIEWTKIGRKFIEAFKNQAEK